MFLNPFVKNYRKQKLKNWIVIFVKFYRTNLEYQVLLQNQIARNVIDLNLLYLHGVGIGEKGIPVRERISFSRYKIYVYTSGHILYQMLEKG